MWSSHIKLLASAIEWILFNVFLMFNQTVEESIIVHTKESNLYYISILMIYSTTMFDYMLLILLIYIIRISLYIYINMLS
jgi:hypothetical protein